MAEESTEQEFGARRTRPHRLSQKKLTRDTVGDNLTFDRRQRLAVVKGKNVGALGPVNGNSRGAVPVFDESTPDSTKNVAFLNVVVGNLNDSIASHNDLVADVTELRRYVTELTASLKAAKHLE
jgi:hypothetical protein